MTDPLTPEAEPEPSSAPSSAPAAPEAVSEAAGTPRSDEQQPAAAPSSAPSSAEPLEEAEPEHRPRGRPRGSVSRPPGASAGTEEKIAYLLDRLRRQQRETAKCQTLAKRHVAARLKGKDPGQSNKEILQILQTQIRMSEASVKSIAQEAKLLGIDSEVTVENKDLAALLRQQMVILGIKSTGEGVAKA